MEFLRRRITTGREGWTFAEARDVRFAEERMVTRGAIPICGQAARSTKWQSRNRHKVVANSEGDRNPPTNSAPVTLVGEYSPTSNGIESGNLEFVIRYERLSSGKR
jgi:hypothetical protein